MNKRSRRIKKQRSASIPAPITAAVGTVAIIKELNDTVLAPDRPMTDEVRRAFQNALHDQVGKVMLHLSAIAIHRQKRQGKIAGMMDFVLNVLSDPEYIKEALTDPDLAIKLLRTLHIVDVDDTKFLYDLAVGTRRKEDAGWDAKSSLNLVVGVSAANPNNLPKELQDPHQLRQFRDKVQVLFDLINGTPVPQAPTNNDRVIRADVIEPGGMENDGD